MAPSSSEGNGSQPSGDSSNDDTNSQKSSQTSSSDSDTDSEAVVLIKSTKKKAVIPAVTNHSKTRTRLKENNGIRTQPRAGRNSLQEREDDNDRAAVAAAVEPNIPPVNPALTVTTEWFGKYKAISNDHVRNQIMLLGHADVTMEQIVLSKRLMETHRHLARDHAKEVVQSMMVTAAQAQHLTWNTRLVTKVCEVRDWWASALPETIHSFARLMYKIQQLPFENEEWSRTAELNFQRRHKLAVQSKPGVKSSGRSCFRAIMSQAKTDITKMITKKAKDKTHGF